MNLNNIFGKVKDLAGNAGEISKLVDMLPENIKSKVKPLIDKFLGGDASAADKAKGLLEKYKDNDTVKKLLSKLP
ncbi:MAG: hypothetical protein IKQ18_06185 [Clostridia bacterium]|nr:hypothetical protein [Clostridia bacterium]